MVKKIAWTDPSTGVLAVFTPAYRDAPRFESETDDELVERMVSRVVPFGTSHRIIETEDLPSSKVFRQAWEDIGTSIRVNMPNARVIHMDRIRAVRDAELGKLDVDYIRAQEANDTVGQGEIAARKQVLRDIPQTFDLSKFKVQSTLNNAWPIELPR